MKNQNKLKNVVLLSLFVVAIFTATGNALAATYDLLANTSTVSTNDVTLSDSQTSDATVLSSDGLTTQTQGTNRGIIINSNPDDSAGEFFEVYDSAQRVFLGDGNTSTIMQSGTATVTAAFNGAVTLNGTSTSITGGGLNVNTNGITNAGAVSGVTTLGASGLVTLDGGITADGGVFTVADATGDIHTGGTLDVDSTANIAGLATLDGGITADGGVFTVADATGNVHTSGDLDSDGNTTLGDNATLDSVTILGVTNVTGVTTITSSGTANQAIVDAASSRFVSADGTQSVAVANANTTITAAAGHTVVVDSATTTINGTASIFSGNGIGNSTVVDATSSRMVSANGANSVDVRDASASMTVANNAMTITGATNTVSIVSDNDALAGNSRSALNMTPTTASLLVNTAAGVSHGVSVSQTNTVISGGTASTSLTLDDNGATFQNTTTGGPARVTGVADGVNDFDAVNVRQLNSVVSGLDKKISTAYSGIASIAALSAIPAPAPGKRFAIGSGYGYFEGKNAVALGATAVVTDNVVIRGGWGYSDSDSSANAGINYSW